MRRTSFTIALLATALASSGCSGDRHAGWKKADDAPWCAVSEATKTLVCRFFSKEHCVYIATLGRVWGPADAPMCVTNPDD